MSSIMTTAINYGAPKLICIPLLISSLVIHPSQLSLGKNPKEYRVLVHGAGNDT